MKNNAAANQKYGKLFSDYEQKYKDFEPLNKQRDYYMEALMGIEAVNYATRFKEVIEALKSGKKQADIQKDIDKLKVGAPGFYKNYDKITDQKIAATLLKLYHADIPKNQQPDIFRTIEKDYNGDFEKYAAALYDKSYFVSLDKVNALLDKIEKNYKKAEKDPVYQLMLSCVTKFSTDVKPRVTQLDNEIAELNRLYMKGLRELVTTKKYYPDANSTLRLAYGKVEGYEPRDAVFYGYYTTMTGLMEKENPNSEEFSVDPKLKELYLKKYYGRYADKNGELRIGFCASNHTTGGNSGSPVFNGMGELIGTNFDRNWEGTMSDIMYDPKQVRNIVLDIHYTLFVIDKFAGAGYLLNEMILKN